MWRKRAGEHEKSAHWLLFYMFSSGKCSKCDKRKISPFISSLYLVSCLAVSFQIGAVMVWDSSAFRHIYHEAMLR